MRLSLFVSVVLFGFVGAVTAGIPVWLVGNQAEPQEIKVFAVEPWALTVVKPKNAGDPALSVPVPELALLLDGSSAALTGHEAAWRGWIERGGILVVSSYESKLLEATIRLFVDGAVAPAACVTNADKGLELENQIVTVAPIGFPYPVADDFCRRSGGWGQLHLTASSEWQRWIDCPEGGTLLAARQLGRGWVVISAFVGFGGAGNRPQAASALMQDILAWRDLVAAGIAVERFQAPAVFGDTALDLGWRNTASVPQTVAGTVRITLPGEKVREVPFAAAVPPGGSLPVAVILPAVRPGRLTGEIELTAPVAKRWQWTAEIAPPVCFEAVVPRFRPEQLAAAPFRLEVIPVAAEEGRYRVECYIDGNPAGDLTVVSSRLATADLRSLAPGKHTAGWRLVEIPPVPGFMTECIVASGAATEFEVAAAEPLVAVDDEGFLRRRGERILPIGFYTVSWRDITAREALLDFSIANGLNLIHASYSGDPEEFGAFAARARSHGINLIVEGVGTQAIQSLKQYDNILAWNIIDEPDLAARPVASIMPRRQELLEADTDRPQYTVIVAPEFFGTYRPIADIIANDYYSFNAPKGLGGYAPIQRRLVGELAGAPQMPFAVLWCYGYSPGDLPTAAQLRSQFYQVLAAGTKGILFYTWNDGRPFALADTPEVADTAAQLAREGRELEDFLLHGFRRMWDFPPLSGMTAARWDRQGRTLLVLANADPQAEARFQLDGDFPAMTECFSTPEQARRVPAGNGLNLTLKPLETVVLRSSELTTR